MTPALYAACERAFHIITADGTVKIIDRNHDTGAMTKTRYRFIRNGPVLIWEDD